MPGLIGHHSVNTGAMACVLSAALLAGCSQSAPSAPAKPLVTGKPQVQEPEAKAPFEPDLPNEPATPKGGKVELQVVDLPGYEAAVARHKGKVVLVDFWATWCGPCRKQFPHSIELQRRYQDRGLVVMSVSIDQMDAGESLDELKAKVLDFLKGQNSTLTNLLVPVTDLAAGDAGASDLVNERFDLDGGAVPHYKLYDRQGSLNRKFIINLETGEAFQDKDVEAAIENLL